MHSLFSWWSSLQTVSTLSTVLKCTGAVVGLTILIVGFRESALGGRAQAAEKTKWSHQLNEARTRADDALAKQQPRLLSAHQSSTITERLQTAFQAGKANVPVVVASRMMDAESLQYGRQIFAAIQKAGWRCEYTDLSAHTFPGLAIFFNPSGASEQCDIVRSAFSAAGIPFTRDYLDVRRTPVQIDSAVYVIVGNK